MKKAFTLTEVLIVLAIIGLVVILLIPDLTKKINNNINSTKLRSSVSKISDALEEVAAEQRVNDITFLYENEASGQEKEEIFLNDKLGVSTSCGSSAEGCFASKYMTINNTELVNFTSGYNAYAITNDKTSVALRFPTSGSNGDIAGEILLDVNGMTPPNVYGYDAFKLALLGDSSIGAYGDIVAGESLSEALNRCKSGSLLNYMCYYYLSQKDWDIDY